eukprot:scaffold2357_cov399-Prasinococcus_capsulatus_cf.AAC.20
MRRTSPSRRNVRISARALHVHFSKAIELYTQAIELVPDSPVYLSNRAFAHLKLENFGAALQDATRAIEIDPTYTKVRGLAYSSNAGVSQWVSILSAC